MISFGDNVRVRQTPLTEERRLAGLVGQVYGETKPSITEVEVIGEMTADYAINVSFESLGKSYWFSPDLLEFVDHAPGTEIKLKGASKKWVRSPSGEWIGEKLEQKRKPWWKFW